MKLFNSSDNCRGGGGVHPNLQALHCRVAREQEPDRLQGGTEARRGCFVTQMDVQRGKCEMHRMNLRRKKSGKCWVNVRDC